MQVIVRGSIPVPGPEDIVVDHARAVAFSASQQRKSATGKLLGSADMPGGAIFALDLASEPLPASPWRSAFCSIKSRSAFRFIRADAACSAGRTASAG